MYSGPIEHTRKHVTPILPNKMEKSEHGRHGSRSALRSVTEIKWTDTRGVVGVM